MTKMVASQTSDDYAVKVTVDLHGCLLQFFLKRPSSGVTAIDYTSVERL